jgi:glucokinase
VTRRLILAVDIGATKTLLTVRSIGELESGWETDHEVVRTATLADPAELVAWIGDEADHQGGRLDGRVAAVGIGAPGPLDAGSGVVTRASNLGWHDVPLAPMLQRRLAAPAALEDDGNTAALGEWRFGAGHAADPFGYVTVSSGIGGGIVAGGELVRGASGNAGEIGHIVIDRGGPRCACGRRGDVESYAGGAALARRARRTWPLRTLPDGRPSPRSAAEIFRAARAGDPDAARIVEEATDALATAFAAMAAVIEPQVIVVGGSIGLAQRRVVRSAAARARKRVIAESGRSLRVEPAALGEESVLAGAADLALRLIGRR